MAELPSISRCSRYSSGTAGCLPRHHAGRSDRVGTQGASIKDAVFVTSDGSNRHRVADFDLEPFQLADSSFSDMSTVQGEDFLSPLHLVDYSLPRRLRPAPEFKILKSIVVSPTINVMYGLVIEQRPSEMLFHHHAVFKDRNVKGGVQHNPVATTVGMTFRFK